MATPPQLSEVKVNVEKGSSGKPVCLLDLKVTKDFGNETENVGLKMSPGTLTAAIESLNKVKAQLDSIAKKTSA